MAEYPSKGKISVRWLSEVINRNLDPFSESDFDTAGLVLYHLRHLGLLNEDKLDFDKADDDGGR